MRLVRNLITSLVFVWSATALGVTPSSFDTVDSARPFSFAYSGVDGLSGTFAQRYYNTRHGALSRYNGSAITEFSLHQEFDHNVVHYAVARTVDEKRQTVGLSLGSTTLAFFSGNGDTFSRTGGSSLYADLDHYFFHGGSRLPFDTRGLGVDFGFAGGVHAQMVGARISSPQVDPRSAYYAGISGHRFSAGLFQTDRGGDRAGHGFNFSFSGDRISLDVAEIRTDTDAHLRQVGLSWAGTLATYSVSYEDARNPLFSDGEEQRVMFRYQRSFGHPSVFNAKEAGAKRRGEGFAKVAVIGAGLGMLAIASSSGDKNKDTANRFGSQHGAALDTLNQINPVSVAENREHGGWVYRNADGSFAATTPVPGDVASVNIGNPITAVPAGTAATASYHTHGGPDPRFVNQEFSPADLTADRAAGVDGYLATPGPCTAGGTGGCAKYHEVVTGGVIILGPIAN